MPDSFSSPCSRLVGHAEKGAVGDAEAKAVGGDGRALHVDRYGAAEIEAPEKLVEAKLPVAIVRGDDGAGAQPRLQILAVQSGDEGHRLLQRDLDLGDRRHRHPDRQILIEHMVVADIAVREDVVAEELAAAQPRAVAEHEPAMRAEHRKVVGDGLGVGRTDADVDEGDAVAVWPRQVVGGHLREIGGRRGFRSSGGLGALPPDDIAGRR